MEGRKAKFSCILRKAIAKNKLNADETLVLLHDLSAVRNNISEIKKLFPPDAVHTVAVKSNPLIRLLKEIKNLGFGAETASIGELYIALKSGFPKNKIIFDSPAKTIDELKFALENNIYINADSLDELDRLNKLIKSTGSKSKIGIRINPQVGTGKIKITSVAAEYSKFGVPLKQFRDELINVFLKYERLTGVHLHIGSQGCPVDMLAGGVKAVYEFAEEVNRLLKSRGIKRSIKYFDIGGGMAVRYSSSDKPDSMRMYVSLLKKNCPALFNGGYKLITEFGRWINANAGWTVSRVEYVKKQEGINTAVIHAGADLFIRRVYSPDDWHNEIFSLDANGFIPKGKKKKYIIAGPLCFAGDIVARDARLNELSPGDFIVICDTGAYTLGMWSRYNSRQMPKVLGYYNDGEKFVILKEKESIDSLYKFWL